jgi:polar amino acid transport system substrate-binding protein
MPGQSWQYRGPRSLREIRLGVVNGYQYGPSVDAALRAPAAAERVSWATGVRASEGNLKKLALGRLDAVLEDRQVMRYLSWAGAGEDRVELRTATCLSEEPPELYVVFERSNPNARRYAQQFSEGMRRLRASGALAEVLGRYGLSDWRHP